MLCLVEWVFFNFEHDIIELHNVEFTIEVIHITRIAGVQQQRVFVVQLLLHLLHFRLHQFFLNSFVQFGLEFTRIIK